MRIPWRRPSTRTDESGSTSNPTAAEIEAVETLATRLSERNVSEADAHSLAKQLSPEFVAQGRGARVAFVDGVAAAWHAAAETRARLDRSVSDIKEVERLMGAFNGELSKLDEVLEVLAAYARRMRTSKPRESSEGQTLH